MHSTHRERLAPALALTIAVAAMALAGTAAAQAGRSTFDHLRTTFPLTGVHAVTPCENCHVGGQMAGTPRQCEFCHRPGSRIATTFKPANHVQTNEGCNTCHRSAATWQGARFNHTTVAPGTCITCHTGFVASGKPANHMPTAAACDTCHRTVTWTFVHPSVVLGSCDTCHIPGGPGLAAPANHIPYKTQLLAGASMTCDACHKSTGSFSVEAMNHNNSQGNGSGFCIGCHLSGTSFLGSMQKNSLTHQQKTPVPTDCSQSGCHRPLGNTGSTYRGWS